MLGPTYRWVNAVKRALRRETDKAGPLARIESFCPAPEESGSGGQGSFTRAQSAGDGQHSTSIVRAALKDSELLSHKFVLVVVVVVVVVVVGIMLVAVSRRKRQANEQGVSGDVQEMRGRRPKRPTVLAGSRRAGVEDSYSDKGFGVGEAEVFDVGEAERCRGGGNERSGMAAGAEHADREGSGRDGDEISL